MVCWHTYAIISKNLVKNPPANYGTTQPELVASCYNYGYVLEVHHLISEQNARSMPKYALVIEYAWHSTGFNSRGMGTS
jgi:hypothetical protein